LQDRAVNGALRFLERQVSDSSCKHYALVLADTPAPERLTQPSAREDGYPRR
jgi:hypothetical protein